MREQLHEILEALRSELEADFGWTHLQVRLELDETRRNLIVSGQVALPRLIPMIARRLGNALPSDWALTSNLTALEPRGFRRLPLDASPAPLFRHCEHTDPRLLTSELLPEDGPLEVITEHAGAHLVRTRDATVGWVRGTLEQATPQVPPSAFPAEVPEDLDTRLQAALEPYWDVPYHLGGTSTAGIDCSGLTRRVYEHAVGIVLPRHSRDQRAIGVGMSRAPRAGDLAVFQAPDEMPSHVGIVLPHAHGNVRIAHASRSRSKVLVDDFTELRQRIQAIHYLPIERLMDFHRRWYREGRLSESALLRVT